MIAAELLTDLAQRGIRLEAHGDRLRYSPRSAMTPDLAERIKANKGELLSLLRFNPDAPAFDLTNADAVWQTTLDLLEGKPLFPTDVMEALRAADVRWESDNATTEPVDDSEAFGPDGWPLDSIDPDELNPCPECGTLELWQTMAGNWRCLRCDPPTKSQRLRNRATRLKSDRIE